MEHGNDEAATTVRYLRRRGNSLRALETLTELKSTVIRLR
jgi:hypothetical protein